MFESFDFDRDYEEFDYKLNAKDLKKSNWSSNSSTFFKSYRSAEKNIDDLKLKLKC